MLTEAVIACARESLGIRETSRNSGPEIDGWLELVGQPPGQPWCAAWVHAMFASASADTGLANPCPKTAGSLRLWEKAHEAYRSDRPQPGAVFICDHGAGLGHCGIVEAVHEDGSITTIEGNTNSAGSRNGDRVARHTWKPAEGKRGRLVGYLCFEVTT